MSTVCDMNCFNCRYEDCINDEDMSLEERQYSREYELSLKRENKITDTPKLGMQRYIHNRPDREAYIKARNAEYEAKRKGRPDRVEYKKRQYQRHREEKLAYQKKYYENNKEEILARQKANYQANKEEINKKRREEYRRRKEQQKRENSKDQ